MTDLNIATEHLTADQGPTKSCFLPGTNIQYAWDSTSLGLLKTCPRLYEYTMIQGWGIREESVHLRFGIEYHSALQDFAIAKSQGQSHDDAIRTSIHALVNRVRDWSVDTTARAGKYKNRHSVVSLVIDYLDHFGHSDPSETFILDNGLPAVELSFRFELDWGPHATLKETWTDDDSGITGHKYIQAQPYLLSGHLDRVVDYNDSLYVMDRKTSLSTLGSYYFDQYQPNNQMTLYTLAGQIVLDTPVKGVIIDAAQVKLEQPNAFQRGFTYRTPDHLDEWLADLRYWLSSAERYATDGYWPQNDTACDKFGGCKFRGVCSKSPSVRETYLKSQFDKLEPEERWNPLKAR